MFEFFKNIFRPEKIFFRSEFFDRICFKFISWSRRIILKKSGVDSDSLEVRKHEDRRIRVSGLRKSKIWSVYTSGAASSKSSKCIRSIQNLQNFPNEKKYFFGSDFFWIFLKFISWSRRIILNTFRVDSDTLDASTKKNAFFFHGCNQTAPHLMKSSDMTVLLVCVVGCDSVSMNLIWNNNSVVDSPPQIGMRFISSI